MKTTYYRFDPRPTEPLQFTAVRYQPDSPPSDGLTLILAHATGTHKETWAPLLEYLFTAQLTSDSNSPKILEAWSMECPNHGESAVINEQDIQEKYPNFAWSGWIYPREMLAFLRSKPNDIDFTRRSLVALGHSHGGNSLILLDSLQNEFQFKGFILLDPTLGRESPAKDHMQRVLTQLTWNKRDTWPNRKAALRDLSKQPGFRNWHPEVLRLFLEKGLRDHPASKLPDPWCFKGGVSLACSRANEAACNFANDHHVFAFDYLQQMYREGKTVHLIHSKVDEFNGVALKQAQTEPEPVSKRGPVTVQLVEKGGHMFVQTNPEQTARTVWNALYHIKNAYLPKEPVQRLVQTGTQGQGNTNSVQMMKARL